LAEPGAGCDAIGHGLEQPSTLDGINAGEETVVGDSVAGVIGAVVLPDKESAVNISVKSSHDNTFQDALPVWRCNEGIGIGIEKQRAMMAARPEGCPPVGATSVAEHHEHMGLEAVQRCAD
jgi:hypothetical protein